MTFEVNLVGQAGLWDGAAKAVIGNALVTGFASAGTTQATGAAVPTADYVVVSTNVAGAGAVLPGTGAAELTIYNASAAALLIYPPVGGTINQAATNASFSVAAGKAAQFQSPNGVVWFATHSA